jgi:hypothetical protein
MDHIGWRGCGTLNGRASIPHILEGDGLAVGVDGLGIAFGRRLLGAACHADSDRGRNCERKGMSALTRHRAEQWHPGPPDEMSKSSVSLWDSH